MSKKSLHRVFFVRQNTFVDDELNDFCSDSSSMWRKIVRSYVRPFRSITNLFHSFISFFPIISWLPNYQFTKQFPGCLFGGIMGGVLNVTQGIAYSVLAGLPPANGLYTTFFGAFTYPLLASWPHGSMAPFAIVELMCGTASDYIMDEYLNSTHRLTPDQVAQITPSTIVSTLTFLVGIISLIFALLRVQFLAQYFSEPLVSGFITAAAIFVYISQVPSILGFKKDKSTGIGYLFLDVWKILTHLRYANIVTIGISAFSLAFLIFGKIYLGVWIQKWTGKRIMIPFELILVILTTFASFMFDAESSRGIQIVGEIPRGFPKPSLPKFFLTPALIWDAFAIAVVLIALHLSVAKVLCLRKKYKVDENQELYAIGLTLSASSILPVFPGSSGLGRPMLLSECGATSQLANIVSGCVVLVVLLALGPLFRALPLCVLSIIVLFVLRSFFGGFWELPRFWRMSRWDFCVWVVTFTSTICTDLIYGLGLGVAFELFTVVARSQWPRWRVSFPKRTSDAAVCAFQFEAMLLFTNAERFKKVVRRVLKKLDRQFANVTNCKRTFIFDCSGITDVDTVGLTAFGQVVKELRAAHCVVFFAGCPPTLIPCLQEVGAWQSEKEVFPNVEDATLQARLNQGNIGTTASFNHEAPRRSASIPYPV